jgi:hypothetical protein
MISKKNNCENSLQHDKKGYPEILTSAEILVVEY